MHPLPLDELDRRWADVEAAADATPGVDPWCSGPDWQLPVTLGFAPDAPRLLLATDDGRGYAFLARYRDEDGDEFLSGLEPLWGFGSPIVGPDPGAVAERVAAVIADDPTWHTLLLPGLPPIPRDRSAATAGDVGNRTTLPIALALSRLGRVGFGQGIARQLVDLTDGYDAWLARRSSRFRRNLRRAQRHAADAGLTIVDASDDPALFDRLQAIERRSWKGQQGSGLVGPDMATMYRAMIDRLQQRRRTLAHVAVVDGREVGFILGGLRDRRYRGLQLSYADEGPDGSDGSGPAALHDLSIGNLLQAHHLALLTDGDLADVYDLGMDIDYKRRWADRVEPSIVLVVQR